MANAGFASLTKGCDKKLANPEEIAHHILYLWSDEASFIRGSDYPIDGGFIKLNT